MSNNKYADLPDIDTAPDVYETEDVFAASHPSPDSSDDEAAAPARSTLRGRNADIPSKDELDLTSHIDPDEATRRFRKAEKRRERSHYAYPPSPTFSSSPGQSSTPRPVPLSHRLRALQAELSALEHELSDPSNPLIQKEREEQNVDPGELIRGLVDVRGRLEKIRKDKEGRGRLVGVVLADTPPVEHKPALAPQESNDKKTDEKSSKSEVRTIVDMDKRVGELEKLVGAATTTLDETSPLPPPLLPSIARLNNQLTLLTQPRHIDSISRRLKLLLSDLERASASQHHNHRRHPSQSGSNAPPSHIQEQLLPLLSRLAPEFQGTLEDLEQEQQKMRDALQQLQGAVDAVEKSLDDNRSVVKSNVAGLDQRVSQMLSRLEDLGRTQY
ncbi:hypothetical protein BDQ17DRAFT_1350367 [Cyathus striatus]|nr:hypothetical protein BDQ17DRAFT_1350367 [Cyathus striatus]